MSENKNKINLTLEYKTPTPAQIDEINEIGASLAHVKRKLEKYPVSRERSLVITNLEELFDKTKRMIMEGPQKDLLQG